MFEARAVTPTGRTDVIEAVRLAVRVLAYGKTRLQAQQAVIAVSLDGFDLDAAFAALGDLYESEPAIFRRDGPDSGAAADAGMSSRMLGHLRRLKGDQRTLNLMPPKIARRQWEQRPRLCRRAYIMVTNHDPIIDDRIKRGAVVLLLHLRARCGKARKLTTWTKSLATELRVSRRTIQLWYHQLEAGEYITRSYDSQGRITVRLTDKVEPRPFKTAAEVAKSPQKRPQVYPQTYPQVPQRITREERAALLARSSDAKLLAHIKCKEETKRQAQREQQ